MSDKFSSIMDLPPPPTTGLVGGEVQSPSGPVGVDALPSPPTTTEQVDKTALPPPPTSLLKPEKEKKDIYLSDTEFDSLAKKHGVSKEELKQIAPYYGVLPLSTSIGETMAGGLKYTAGVIGRELLLNVPQWLAKKAKEPGMREALDELQAIHTEGTPWYSAENLVGLVAPSGLLIRPGLTAARRVGLGGTVGAVSGLATSREDEEVSSLLIGAGLGATVGLAVEGVQTLGNKAAKTVKKAVDEVIDSLPGEKARKEMEKMADSEAALRAAVVRETPIESIDDLKKALSEDDIKKIANLISPLDERIDPSIPSGLHLDILDSPEQRALYLIRHNQKLLGAALAKGAKTKDIKEGIARVGGGDFVERQFTNMRYGQYLSRALIDDNLSTEKVSAGALRKMWMFFSDARYVMDSIDTRFGTRLTPVFDRVSANYNAYNYRISPLMKQLKEITDEANRRADRLGVSREEFQQKVGKAMYDGNISSLDQEYRDIAIRFKDYFENAAKSLETFASDFSHLDLSPVKLARNYKGVDKVYYPHYTVDPIQYAQRTLDLSNKLPKDIIRNIYRGSKVPEEFSSDANNLRIALESWWGKPLTSQEDVVAALTSLKSFQKGRVSFDLNIQGRSFFERDDEVPEFLVNMNAVENAISWTQNMFRYVALRNPLDELSQSAKALDIAAPSFATYVRNYVADLSGVRHDSFASKVQESFDRFRLYTSKKANDANTGWEKKYWTILSNADQIMRQASGHLYSFYLGGNLPSVLRNIPQTFLLTSPAISSTSPRGMIYSYNKTLKSYKTVMEKIKDKNFLDEMRRYGQLPLEQTFEALTDIRRGIASTKTRFEKTHETLEAISRASLVLYRGTDTVTRASTKIVAEEVIDDVQKKVPEAIEALMNTPIGYRTRLVELVSKGDYAEAKKLYTDYLLGKTQLNYNRAAMSEYGRYMGWMFSMFSKWPTVSIGEIGSMIDRWSIGMTDEAKKEFAMAAAKYFLPFIIFQGIQSGFYEDFAKENPVVGSLFGEDITKFSPSDTLTQLGQGIAGGNIPVGKVPWILDIPAKTLMKVSSAGKAAMEGREEVARKELERAIGFALESATSLAPGGILIKASTYWYGQIAEEQPLRIRDLPIYTIEGETPKRGK